MAEAHEADEADSGAQGSTRARPGGRAAVDAAAAEDALRQATYLLAQRAGFPRLTLAAEGPEDPALVLLPDPEAWARYCGRLSARDMRRIREALARAAEEAP